MECLTQGSPGTGSGRPAKRAVRPLTHPIRPSLVGSGNGVSRLIAKKAGVAIVTRQVHQALSKDDKLDVLAFESITSARRWRGAHKLEEE